MDSVSLSNRHPFRKDGITHDSVKSLDSLNIKLHALASIASHTVNDLPSHMDLLHILSGVADLLQAACVQCDQILEDIAEVTAKPNPSK